MKTKPYKQTLLKAINLANIRPLRNLIITWARGPRLLVTPRRASCQLSPSEGLFPGQTHPSRLAGSLVCFVTFYWKLPSVSVLPWRPCPQLQPVCKPKRQLGELAGVLWTCRPGPASNLGDSNHTRPRARRELSPRLAHGGPGPSGVLDLCGQLCTGVSHCACPSTDSETLLQPIRPTPVLGSCAVPLQLHTPPHPPCTQAPGASLSLLELSPARRCLC